MLYLKLIDKIEKQLKRNICSWKKPIIFKKTLSDCMYFFPSFSVARVHSRDDDVAAPIYFSNLAISISPTDLETLYIFVAFFFLFFFECKHCSFIERRQTERNEEKKNGLATSTKQRQRANDIKHMTNQTN